MSGHPPGTGLPGADADLAGRIGALDERRRAVLAALLAGTDGARDPGATPAAGPNGATAAGSPASAGPVPLSYGQERLWLLEQLHPGTTAFVFATATELRGPLRPAALRAALTTVVTRHEALRTVVRPGPAAARQHVLAPAPVPLAVVAAPDPATARRVVREQAGRPFDLERGPLLRAVLVRRAPDRHVLVLAVHHLAVDGWSMALLVDDLRAAYDGPAAGRPVRLDPVPAQYRDFTAWQRERLAGTERDELLEFWLPQVRDMPRTRLQPDLAAGPGAEQRGATWVRTLDPELSAAVRRVAGPRGASPFMAVLTAFAQVLAGVTGEDDLAVATLAAGRVRAEFERLVGYLGNVLVLRLRDARGGTPEDRLARVRDVVLAAYAHQELPFEQLLESGRLPREADGLPPVRLLAVSQPPVPALDLPGLAAVPLPVQLGTGQFDVVLEVRAGDRIEIALQYDAARFEPGTVEHLAAATVDALRCLVGRPAREQVPPTSVGPPVRPPAATVHELAARAAAARPDAVLLVHGDRQVTAGAVQAAANRLARLLRRRGIRPEDRVAVVLPRSPWSVIAALAALEAGAAFVPLDPAHPVERLRAVLEQASAACVVGTAELLAAGGWTGIGIAVDADLTAICAESPAAPRVPVHPDQLAYLIFTSGSTGGPKGVQGPHRGTVNRLAWMAAAHPPGPDDVAAVRTPPAFVDAVAEVFGPLATGTRAVLVDAGAAADPDELVRVLGAQRVTRLLTVPSLLRMLLAAVPDLDRRLPLLRLVACSGERLPAELAEAWHRALPGRVLLNLYGSSEVAADATAGEVPAGAGRREVTIGRPIAGMAATVLDPAGAPVPPLARGQLQLAGPGLARGYAGRPAETAAAFRPDATPGSRPGARAFRTGDLVRRRPDGELEYLDRLDAQVQVRGQRVEPAEVERALLAVAGVEQACVVPYEDASGGTALRGYLAGGAPVDVPAVLAALRERLPGAYVPGSLVELDELPLTSSGKVDRQALRRAGAEPPPTGSADPADLSPLERAVADVFAGLLPEGGPPGPDASFFARGGHSLLAATAVLRLRQRCRVRVDLADLFAAPTVRGLAARLAAAEPAEDADPIAPDPDAAGEPFALTDVQQAYWVGRDASVELGGVATHSYVEIDVPDLDVARLADALNQLVRRHGMLRAVLLPDGTQRVLPEVPPYRVPVLDLAPATEPERAAGLAAVRAEMSHQVLPADRWPLFDVRVSRLGGTGARVHVGVDALICDNYSFRVLMGELERLYRDPGAPLPELTVSYRDCVLALQPERRPVEHERAWRYWSARAAELPPGPDLPETPGGPAEPDGPPRFTRRDGSLDPESWRRLKARAAAAGLTASGLLLAGYAEVLSRWARRPHYTITLTVFDRPPDPPEVRHLVGDFTSLTLLEVDHRAGGRFTDRARAVQERLWSDLDHRGVTAVSVLRERVRAGRLAPGAFAPVVFTSNLGVGDEPAGTTGGLGTLHFGITQTPQVLLDHQVSEVDGELRYNWDAVEARFPPGVLDAMFAAYVHLLARLAGGEAAWTAPQPVPLPAAQAARFRDFNATDVPVPAGLLHTPVAAAARRWPAALAVVAADAELTYAELAARAGRVARVLRGRGVRPGELVGVAVRKSWEGVVALLGVLASGGAYVPLDPDLPAERMASLVDRTRIRVLLTRSDLAGGLAAGPGVEVLSIDREDTWAAAEPRLPEPVQDPTDLAYLIFTSGSTGEPKGVMIDHRGALNTVAAVTGRFAVGPGDRVLALSSFGFDLSVYDVFGTLAAGGTLVLPDPARGPDPRHWAELVDRWDVTVWNSVPALMRLACEHAEAVGARLPSLRAVLLSGDWIPLDLPDRVRAIAAPVEVVSLGGATEASIWSVWYPIGPVQPSWASVPYGRPMPNQRLRVLDGELADRPEWVTGDLHIGGIGVALGYWRDPERTAASFLTDPATGERLYRTGDLARHRDDGTLEFLGREDSQVKVNGYRVELGEIEAALARVPGLTGAAVVAVGDPHGDRKLVAYVVGDGRPGLDPPGLRAQLAAMLPAYLVPASFVTVPALPLTANGKVDRGALAAGGEQAQPAPAPAPASAALQRELGELWAAVLGVPAVAPDDDFFDLGGTSLVGIRLIARLQERYGIRLPLARLYEAPTVARLAAAVAEARAAAGAPAAEAVAAVADPDHRHEPFALTEIQQAYWVGRSGALDLGGVATHSYVELDVQDLDVPRLEAALRRLVDRHPALRTVVDADGRQRVLPAVPPYPLAYRDLSAAAEEERRLTLAEVRARMSHQVFDAATWPLFEVRAHRLPAGVTRLHLGIDLLIADAHSMQILQRELMAAYADPNAPLESARITFRDYLAALAELRRTPRYADARRYWSDRVETLPLPPELPLRRPVTEIERPIFARCAGELDADTWAALRERAAVAALTPSGLLCAAFADVLGLWAQSRRFTLNVTTFNRQPLHPDVGRVVGDFTSTALLAVDLTGATFAERARAVQLQLWRDLDHDLVGGVEVLRMMRRHPGRRYQALAPVVFTSTLVPDDEPAPGDRPAPPPWRARQVYGVSQTPQVLLDHQVFEHPGGLSYTWDHVEAAFPPGLVASMTAAYTRLLQTLATAGSWEGDPR